MKNVNNLCDELSQLLIRHKDALDDAEMKSLIEAINQLRKAPTAKMGLVALSFKLLNVVYNGDFTDLGNFLG